VVRNKPCVHGSWRQQAVYPALAVTSAESGFGIQALRSLAVQAAKLDLWAAFPEDLPPEVRNAELPPGYQLMNGRLQQVASSLPSMTPLDVSMYPGGAVDDSDDYDSDSSDHDSGYGSDEGAWDSDDVGEAASAHNTHDAFRSVGDGVKGRRGADLPPVMLMTSRNRK